jgi:uncharacterized protein YcfJ
MKRFCFVLVFASLLPLATSAQAAGCFKGAVVGGVAGHYAHHHAILGAIAGCAVGHHMAAKQAREEEERRHQIAKHSGAQGAY